ncbi:lipid phosphate phosphatase 1 [Dichomitus squalens LYAD-421 SS1]|uniref:Lipid phosphate phosphatase 1 n=2 Tax=Dichomitus squalens TaxID=114155 RepID=A0A4Q9N0X6_9APHY|nr:lipid phosphate phosphatase 1 [Dichomitus squalens LYAD-421 SS1]EJF57189.1 lipid phosphate phosphatase 1 [Dichomitus squalens LYAD-421 SS1]TBU34104.1 lipid phosphate phosphatase 1 [Dichomitus squalens]
MSRQLYSSIQNSLDKRFGGNPFTFFDRAYLVDWVASSLLWLAAWYIKGLPPFERDFSTKDDLIDHKHRPNQISGGVNWLIAFIVPIVISVLWGIVRRSALEVHHGVLAIYSGRGLTVFITEALKNRVGRLRPDFLHRCKWDKELKACTGELEKVMDGRRSFPSGHASTAFAGMTFLALYLAGLTGAWRLAQPAQGGSLLRSKLARLVLTLLPLGFATWVAVSRVEDYRHHKEDVIVGSLLGVVCATICYLIYWPNPFAPSQAFTARAVYGGADADSDRVRMPNPQRYGYELTGLNEEHAEQSV